MRWPIIILPSYNVELLHFLAWLMLPSHGFCYTKRKIAYNNSYSIEFFSVFCTVVVRRLKITITYRLITYIFDSVSWIIRFYIKWHTIERWVQSPSKRLSGRRAWNSSKKLPQHRGNAIYTLILVRPNPIWQATHAWTVKYCLVHPRTIEKAVPLFISWS